MKAMGFISLGVAYLLGMLVGYISAKLYLANLRKKEKVSSQKNTLKLEAIVILLSLAIMSPFIINAFNDGDGITSGHL